jgi:hypothetical protein
MILFVPIDHPDFFPLCEWEGATTLSNEAAAPALVKLDRASGRYTYRRSGEAAAHVPMQGTLLEVDREQFEGSFTYDRFLTVPVIPMAFGEIPSY